MKPKTTDVTGTVTEKTLLIPICYDAIGESIRVDGTSVEAALKSLKLEADVLGFEFEQAVKAKLHPTAGGEEITFTRKRSGPTTYMFATAVYGREDFASLADASNPLSAAFNRIPKAKLADPDSVVYASIMGLTALQPCDQQRIVLIDKQGRQLFPKPGG
ncbi:MAG: hypothetical protein EPN97_04110 [Alphaproteobacteria bacterium]|nr:MAG: hypothetical protein EPN97_04110 [Alphaproteobacteria bacterium]